MSTVPSIIVTGASSGVGYATVTALVQEHGARVLAISRNAVALERLHRALAATGLLQVLPLDLTSPTAPAQVRARVGEERVHGLVHNAGLLHKVTMGCYTAADLQALYAVNVFAPLLLTQALASCLGGTPPGHLVHIGSMGGFQDSAKFPGLAGYSSSKAALACMAQCLAEEFSGQGIRSNCLALGAVDTPMLAAAFPGYQAPTSAEQMGRFVARFVLEGHNHFNGKVLPVATSTP